VYYAIPKYLFKLGFMNIKVGPLNLVQSKIFSTNDVKLKD